jgi:FkbM family methyltransferase
LKTPETIEYSRRNDVPMNKTPTENENVRGKISGALTSSSFVRRAYSACAHIPLLGSLVRGAAGSLLPAEKRVWVRIPGGRAKGLWLNIDPRFDSHFLEKVYESKVQELLAAHLKPGDCFFDVGANIGFISLLAAQLVGQSGKVVAFEPEPRNARVISANAEKNDLPQLHLVEAAAWSSSGPLEFGRANEASSNVDGQVIAISARNPDRIQVKGIALDDFVFRGGGAPPNFLKIDVEGAEFEVLKGAAEIIKSVRPLVLCEIHYPADVAKIDEWLIEKGYQLRPLDERKSTPTWLLASPGRIQVPGSPPQENLPLGATGERGR